MKKEIPHVTFSSSVEAQFGFEIIPIQKIADHKEEYDVNPEQAHQLKFYNLIFFTEGEGQHFIDFNWYPVKKNSLIYLSKEQVNAFQLSKQLKGYCIVFTAAYFAESFTHLPEEFVLRLFNPQLSSPVLQIPENSAFNLYLDLLRKEYAKGVDPTQKNILKSLFTILLSKAEQVKQQQTIHFNNSSKISLFQQFSSLLESQFNQTRNAAAYAKELAITYKHLNTVCKELTNKTAKNIIDDFVILKAKRSLVNSSLKSNEIAYEIGFEDPTNFSKYFKKHTGLTPRAFKKSLYTT